MRTRIALAVAAVGMIVAGVIVALAAGGDDGDVTIAATSTTAVSSSTTSTTLSFEAPPAQEPATPSTATPAPPPTEPPTTEPPPTTSTTAAPTTTTPPRADAGPTVTGTEGDHDELQAALDVARARWDGRSFDGYVYRTTRVCFCPRSENEIFVDDAGVVTGQRTISGEPESEPPTIDDLFDQLEAAIDGDAASISASFEQTLGYPVRFSIDFDEMIADEEQGRTTRWLTPA